MRHLALFVAISLLAACGGDETVARYGGAGKVWQLTELNGKAAPAPMTIQFPETGQISGRGPCNGYSARMTAPYPWFEVTNLTATRAACPDLAAEQRYFDALTRVTQSEVLTGTLILSGPELEMVFKAAG